MRIVHVSDVHFSTFEKAPWRELLGKSLFGAAGLYFGRKNFLSQEVFHLLSVLQEDIASQNADLIVITGDLTSLSLPLEFERAKKWVEGLGPPHKIMIIPGNHDYYTTTAIKNARFESLFGDYLNGPTYPQIKLLGDSLCIIGVCTAVDSWASNGELGTTQRQRISEALHNNKGRTRLVAMHHPPTPKMQLGNSFGRALLDSEELLSVITGHVDMILHGHEHSGAHYQLLDTSGWRCEVFDAGSATWLTQNDRRRARYNVYTFDREHLQEAQARVYSLQTKRFEPRGHPRPHPKGPNNISATLRSVLK